MENAIVKKYEKIIEENMDYILNLYYQFENKKPIMLYNIQEKRIYAYPPYEFIADQSENSRKKILSQYEDAVINNQIVIFIKDRENKKLMSYTFDIE